MSPVNNPPAGGAGEVTQAEFDDHVNASASVHGMPFGSAEVGSGEIHPGHIGSPLGSGQVAAGAIHPGHFVSPLGSGSVAGGAIHEGHLAFDPVTETELGAEGFITLADLPPEDHITVVASGGSGTVQVASGIMLQGSGGLGIDVSESPGGSAVVKLTQAADAAPKQVRLERVGSVADGYQTFGVGTEVFDPHGFHDTGANTDRLTVPVGMGGLYLAGGEGQSDNSDEVNITEIHKNAGATVMARATSYTTAGNGAVTPHVTTLVQLSAGDYLRLNVTSSGGGNISLARFWMVRLGDAAA